MRRGWGISPELLVSVSQTQSSKVLVFKIDTIGIEVAVSGRETMPRLNHVVDLQTSLVHAGYSPNISWSKRGARANRAACSR